MIIAVDGPAASGKGTIARALARHFRLPHLDTGLLYRAVALTLIRMELEPSKEADAVAASGFDELILADSALRDDDVGRIASVVSAHPLVRAALLQRQKRFAHQAGGAVLDGRDIGTVIAPDADAKLFIKASASVRAQRRHHELRGRGDETSFDRVLADIRARDTRDATRATAPLSIPADAAVLDTTALSVDAAVARAIALVEEQVRDTADQAGG